MVWARSAQSRVFYWDVMTILILGNYQKYGQGATEVFIKQNSK
jgi:hypothetical protein